MMARKTVNKLNGFDSRDTAWKAIREKKVFTVRDIHMETTLDISTIRDYLTGLTKAGFLEKEDVQSLPDTVSRNKAPEYTLVKDVGADAPRVRKDGTLVTQGQGRINMWRSMKIMKTFTTQELAVTASTPTCTVKHATAEDYCYHLNKAGYLGKIEKGMYFFINSQFTGPKPPMIQRVKRVWDQNLKKVMWPEDGQEETPSGGKGKK